VICGSAIQSKNEAKLYRHWNRDDGHCRSVQVCKGSHSCIDGNVTAKRLSARAATVRMSMPKVRTNKACARTREDAGVRVCVQDGVGGVGDDRRARGGGWWVAIGGGRRG